VTEPSVHRPMFAGVIFDLDGTLADSLDFSVESIRLACEETSGHRFRDEEVRAHFGPSEEGVIRSLVGPELASAAYRRFWEIYRDGHRRRVAPFNGVVAMLRGLESRGLWRGVVTGKGEETAGWTLREAGLAGWFPPPRCGTPEGGFKAENLRATADEWMVPPGGVAYVGDQSSDVTIARRVGLRPVGAGWAPGTDRAGLALAGAEVVLRAPKELLKWVDGQIRASSPTVGTSPPDRHRHGVKPPGQG
jgi:pyrophosphatase PpaX